MMMVMIGVSGCLESIQTIRKICARCYSTEIMLKILCDLSLKTIYILHDRNRNKHNQQQEKNVVQCAIILSKGERASKWGNNPENCTHT